IPGRFPAPPTELKRLIMAPAVSNPTPKQPLALFGSGPRPVHHKPLPVKKKPLGRPNIEMTEPQLLIDENEQPVDLRHPVPRNLEVESTGHMQAFQIIAPIERYMIVVPITRH